MQKNKNNAYKVEPGELLTCKQTTTKPDEINTMIMAFVNPLGRRPSFLGGPLFDG